MKKIILAALVAFAMAPAARAHDEGHGPKLADTGKFGGLVAPVVLKAEAAMKSKATLAYKAELVRASDGTVRLYVYDKAMKPADLKTFDAKASASLIVKAKGQTKHNPFALEQKDGALVGTMPKPEAKPYTIEVTLKEGAKELLTAFQNLD